MVGVEAGHSARGAGSGPAAPPRHGPRIMRCGLGVGIDCGARSPPGHCSTRALDQCAPSQEVMGQFRRMLGVTLGVEGLQGLAHGTWMACRCWRRRLW